MSAAEGIAHLSQAALFLAFLILSQGLAQGEPCQAGPVRTQSGEVCGKTLEVEGKTLVAFLGIPYAESTAGSRRWMPPVPKAPWAGRWPATQFGEICPQNYDTSKLPPQSEDCLSLNVWTPQLPPQGGGLSVLVYIYGGAFKFGASAEPIYDGAYLAARHGTVIREQPLVSAQQGGLGKPSLIGTNTDESIVFVAGISPGPVNLIVYTALFNVLMGDAGPALADRYAAKLLRDYREPLEAFVNDYLFYCPNDLLARLAKAPVHTYRFTHAPAVSL